MITRPSLALLIFVGHSSEWSSIDLPNHIIAVIVEAYHPIRLTVAYRLDLCTLRANATHPNNE